jgi:hypothetical protein
LSYVALTSAAVSVEPSWNLMPGWILNVYVSPSGEIFHSLATSPMIFG